MSRITCIVIIVFLLIPCISNAETIKVVYEDNRFTAFNNGIVKDSQTDLEWIAGPDEYTSYDMAKNRVIRLNKKEFAGGGWRMPTIAELKTMKGSVNSLFKITGWWIWSGETKGDSMVWFFLFDYNWIGFNYPSLYDHRLRGFAVRIRK